MSTTATIAAVLSILKRILDYVDKILRKQKEADRQVQSDSINADPADWMQNHFADKTDKTDNRDGKTE